jgi:hypothetical protein
MDRIENTAHCYSSIVAVETCLCSKALPSNGSCIFVNLAVVTQQWVYMPQYLHITNTKIRLRHGPFPIDFSELGSQ